ncbi:DUF3231 family protein [Lysinibacillus parviboronicapiens]|uniref:DUF3231 family protein n=1 Tax=Lysinibacillus parviboronicapiens TaxID=436516 RepID=A0ABV2PFL2_9BACI|nr:DUF3231 family protein [Lysinibacillus parviboronicapiens]
MAYFNGNLTSLSLRFNELFTIWTHLTLNNGYITANHSFYKHALDKDLRAIIVEFIEVLKDGNKQLEQLLTENHIAIPPMPRENLTMQLRDIRGVKKVNDTDISAVLSMNIASALIASTQAMEASTQTNLTKLFGQFHMKNAILGAKLIQLSKDKGWLPVPTTIS